LSLPSPISLLRTLSRSPGHRERARPSLADVGGLAETSGPRCPEVLHRLCRRRVRHPAADRGGPALLSDRTAASGF